MAEFSRADAALWRRAAPLVDELLELDPAIRVERLEAIAREEPDAHRCVRAWLLALESEDLHIGVADGLVDALFAAGDTAIARSGERVGPFRLLREIGRGGMGTVYAAERIDGGFAQQVAVKILKAGLDTEQVLRRFLAERRILARLEHPHIARLIDGGVTDDGLPWFAMELVEGRPITDSVMTLDPSARLALFLDLCDAVAFAHANQVIHRDIKPSNVLVDTRGQVKLLDFGIAKLLDPAEESLTRSAVRLMTPQYAAPEQEQGGAVTIATDVWQLGRLLRQLVPSVAPKDLDRIVARATHEDPERRYPSAVALADDVRRLVRGESVLARGDSAVYRMRRALRRPRVAAGLAALALLVVLAVGAAAMFRRETAADAAPLRFELVSTFPGSHRQATFSPDGESIAFLMDDARETPQVWIKRLSGGDPVQRTFDPRGAHRPRWSPREDAIFYDVPAAGIWSMPAHDGAARQLIAEGFNVNLLADGTQLVYEVDAFLWTARADGTGARRIGAAAQTIAKEHAFIESTPAYSPDGRVVTYFQDRDSPVSGDIWSVTLATGQKRQLTFDNVEARHPVWMPDGSGVVYSSGRRGGLTLWLSPAAGGEPRPLTTGTGEDSEAAISADGRRLIYTNARNLLRIMWLDPTSGSRRQLFETRALATHPSFSPDGSRVVFFHGDSRQMRLATVGADGSAMRDLTDGTRSTVIPEWSPDGRWIHFYDNSPSPSFNRIAAGGGEPEILAPGWRFMREHGAHVSPDNRTVAYTVLSQGAARETRVRDLGTGAEYSLAQPILWPRWSPDGRQLAGRSTERELVVCPASTAPCRPLGVSGTEPRWSGDGRQLYFVTYAGYQGSREPRVTPLWKVALDGSAPAHVADLEGPSPLNFFYDVSSTGAVTWASFVPGRQELWMTELPSSGRPVTR